MAAKYNFLEDSYFTTYEDVKTPTIKLPLLGDVELPWADSVVTKPDGTQDIVVKKHVPQMIVDNTEEYKPSPQYQQVSTNSKDVQTQVISKSDKKLYAKQFFMNKGLSEHAASGIVGNLIVESNLNTTAKGDGGKAFGIAQWHPNRQKGLIDLAYSRGTDISDFDTQLEYVWQEINGSQKHYKVLEGLMNSKTASEAAESFMNTFERPNKNPRINGIKRRMELAQSLINNG